jgi:hypothetical protein
MIVEYARMKKNASHYYDVDKWERQRGEEARARILAEKAGLVEEKKVTKKDMASWCLVKLMAGEIQEIEA